MVKQNIVEEKRTPDHERERKDEHWDKEAAAEFKPMEKPDTVPVIKKG